MKKQNGKKGKYPSKGMNALAKKRPDVAKKIMGYKDGGPIKKTPVNKAQFLKKIGKTTKPKRRIP